MRGEGFSHLTENLNGRFRVVLEALATVKGNGSFLRFFVKGSHSVDKLFLDSDKSLHFPSLCLRQPFLYGLLDAKDHLVG